MDLQQLRDDAAKAVCDRSEHTGQYTTYDEYLNEDFVHGANLSMAGFKIAIEGCYCWQIVIYPDGDYAVYTTEASEESDEDPVLETTDLNELVNFVIKVRE